jgi:hypothetical protein
MREGKEGGVKGRRGEDGGRREGKNGERECGWRELRKGESEGKGRECE